jgi:hypothetical protein
VVAVARGWLSGLAGLVLIGGWSIAGCDDDPSSADERSAAAEVSAVRSSSLASTPRRSSERSTNVHAGTNGSPPRRSLTDDDATLTLAVADSFCAPAWTIVYPDGTTRVQTPRPLRSEEEAQCIAGTLVDRLGAFRLAELPLRRGPWSALSLGLKGMTLAEQIRRREAEAIVDTFRGCTPHLQRRVVVSGSGLLLGHGDFTFRLRSGRLDEEER